MPRFHSRKGSDWRPSTKSTQPVYTLTNIIYFLDQAFPHVSDMNDQRNAGGRIPEIS